MRVDVPRSSSGVLWVLLAGCGAAPVPADGNARDASAGDAADGARDVATDGRGEPDAVSPDADRSDAVSPDADRSDAVSPDARPADAGVTAACPPGASSLVLDLAGVTLARVPGVPIADGFAAGFGILEGPVWARGALYVSHFGGGATPASRIYRIDPGGAVTIAAASAGTNGLALSPDGRLHGGRHADGSVSAFAWDALDAAPTPVVRSYMGARFNSPNDLAFRADGTLYFTDPSWQAPSPAPQAAERAYRVARDGTVAPIAGTPSRPNGVALSLDEGTLYITGTDGLRRYPLAADGAIAGPPVDVPAVTGGLDGMGRDCAGNLYVAGGDRVVVLSASLVRVGMLAAPGASNVAFGGADQRTLYVTTIGAAPAVLAARLNVPGLPY